MDKIKVLQVNKLYAPHTGGVEKVVQDLAEGLKDEVDMKVLVCQNRGKTSVEFVNGVEITRAGSLGILFSMPLSISFFSHLRRLSKDRDIVHFHMPFPLGDAAFFLSGFKEKVVVWWHSDIVRQKLLAKLYKPLMDKFLKRADCIIVATQEHIDSSQYLSPYRHKCVIIPFGIDVHAFTGASLQGHPELPTKINEIKNLLFVGRLIYYKGVSVLLDAFSMVHGARLHIIGDGPLKPQLEQQAKGLGIAENVIFWGKVDDEQMKKLMHDCDMLVLPSIANSEAFGLVQIEAMACSKPIINTSLPTGVPYVSLHGQTGLTVTPGDAAALGKAIQRLVDNDVERLEMGARARERAEKFFSLSGMLGNVYKQYKSLLGNHP